MILEDVLFSVSYPYLYTYTYESRSKPCFSFTIGVSEIQTDLVSESDCLFGMGIIHFVRMDISLANCHVTSELSFLDGRIVSLCSDTLCESLASLLDLLYTGSIHSFPMWILVDF